MKNTELRMIRKKITTCCFTLLLSLFFGFLIPLKAEEIEPVHYAYANYLGSGIYRTTGQEVMLINLPFSFELGKKDELTYSLRAPISLGFFDFELANIPELEFPDQVGTFTFTPGIQFNYQYTDNLMIESYIDLGYARNLTTDRELLVHSAGVSSLYSFDIGEYDSIWASRIYYAGYDGHNYEADDTYAAIQIGIDTGLPLSYEIFGYTFQPRLFATAFWYFTEVNFNIPIVNAQGFSEKNKVTLTNSFELGTTMKFDKIIGYSWAGLDTIGLSYRFSKNINAVRLIFSFPI